MRNWRIGVRGSVSAVALIAALGQAQAQQTGPVDPGTAPQQSDADAQAPDDAATGEIIVTGFRKSVQDAINLKRRSDVILDAISADDIASMPEANIAESLQRIPGVSIDRDNGEGRSISVRGLGGDFTRVRINNLEALSTTGVLSGGQSTANTSRGFDFNTFASELFNQASVRKTASAETDEGSLGATVDLTTARPFNYKGQRLALSVQDAYFTNGDRHNPRLSGLYSNRFFNDRVGVLLSGAWQKRDVVVSNYKRPASGNGDLLNRNSTNWAGNEFPQRGRFAAPAGTTFNQSVLTTSSRCPGVTTGALLPIGTICAFQPGVTTPVIANGVYTSSAVTPAITNPLVLAAQTGSDPAAYAALYPAAYSPAGRFDASTVIFPSLPGLVRQDLKTERLGLTGSLQFQVSERTLLTFDGLYSSLKQVGEVSIIEPVGFGRNNTNATLNTLQTGANVTTRRGLYPSGSRCTPNAGGDFAAAQDCGGATLVPGTSFSFNPNNLEAFDYYNSPTSVGYNPADPANAYGIAGLIPLIGYPTTKVLGANVTNGVVDYLKLTGVDWRSMAQRTAFNTKFKQGSLRLDHEFSDVLSMNATIGWSRSTTLTDTTQVEFNSLDRPEAFVFDERGGGGMPVFDPGFDLNNPANWGIVKGLSVFRHNIASVTNEFRQARADFKWDANDAFSVSFGGSYKQYDFATTSAARVNDTLNPTEKEAGVTVQSLGRTVAFGEGLKLPEGTATSFFVPNLAAFSQTFGFDCNCVNKFGDWRVSRLRSTTVGNNFGVSEKDTAGYVQANFNSEVFGRRLSGNFGLRVVNTRIESNGLSTVGRPLTGTNDYTDFLPSFNATYEAAPDLLIRFGASGAMARPQLALLSPSVTQISIPTTGADVGGTLSVGNPRLSPYRSSNLDLAAEWYFRPRSLISVGLFRKDISSYPQIVLYDAPLSTFLDPAAIAALRAQFPGVDANTPSAQQAYIDANNPFTARQAQDAPGGYLQGIEINIQSDFWFLPGFLKNFGFQLNGTKIKSELTYILDPGVRQNGMQVQAPSFGKGPWLNASPEAVNFTFYYQDKKFSARTSLAWRSDYYTNYPIAAGSCNPGLLPPTNNSTPAAASATATVCDSPLINDFVSAKGGLNVDAVIGYNLTDFLSFRLEALNLTNNPDGRYAYDRNPQVTNYASTGTQYTFGARLTF